MTLAVTQTNVAVLGQPAHPDLGFTRVEGVVLGTDPNPYKAVTRVAMNFLGKQPAPLNLITRVVIQVLATRTPIYRFTDVIVPDIFPYDISYNSVGSTRFATDVIVVDSGDDQRNQRWDQPLMEYDIAYGVRTMEQLHALISFFRAMRGRLYAFNYRDPVDQSSSQAVAVEARSPPPPTPLDQQIGLGDGQISVFQLSKTYTTPSGLSNQTRPITRPDTASVRIALNGVEISNWTVSRETGVVTMLSPLTVTLGHTITKSGTTIVGQAGDFTAFKPYQGTARGVILSGFHNTVNNVPINFVATVRYVADDGSSMSFWYPSGFGGADESGTNHVSITMSPAPVAGDRITAGFKFFVPCRFDTDTLPVQLEDYGIGSSNSIKLIEVRPSAF